MAAKDTDTKKPEENPDTSGVMLDMSQTAVKKMIATARARGYITYDELNEALPPDQVTSEQIEDVMAMLSEMGINTIEGDDADDEDRRDETPEPADEALTWRLREAAEASHRADSRPTADSAAVEAEAEAELSQRLQALVEGEIWKKPRKR
jgi:RNA polymerase primary sigma factor